jgi:hypothetical protein
MTEVLRIGGVLNGHTNKAGHPAKCWASIDAQAWSELRLLDFEQVSLYVTNTSKRKQDERIRRLKFELATLQAKQ